MDIDLKISYQHTSKLVARYDHSRDVVLSSSVSSKLTEIRDSSLGRPQLEGICMME